MKDKILPDSVCSITQYPIDYARGDAEEKAVWKREIWLRMRAGHTPTHVSRDFMMSTSGIYNIVARYALVNF